jgi:hypothetical protein
MVLVLNMVRTFKPYKRKTTGILTQRNTYGSVLTSSSDYGRSPIKLSNGEADGYYIFIHKDYPGAYKTKKPILFFRRVGFFVILLYFIFWFWVISSFSFMGYRQHFDGNIR